MATWGLPLAVTTAQAGFAVTGFDIDPTKMKRLDAGQSYIEAVSDADLVQVRDRFDWTTDFAGLAGVDVIVICVPTPLTRQPRTGFVLCGKHCPKDRSAPDRWYLGRLGIDHMARHGRAKCLWPILGDVWFAERSGLLRWFLARA